MLGLKINNIHVCALWVCINDKNDENAEKLQKNMRHKSKKMCNDFIMLDF